MSHVMYHDFKCPDTVILAMLEVNAVIGDNTTVARGRPSHRLVSMTLELCPVSALF